jgi:S-formylglutathione hydrolase
VPAAADPQLSRHEVESDLVPSPVEVALVVHPDVVSGQAGAAVPLVLALHGGGGGAGFAEQIAALTADAWASGHLPPSVVAIPQSGRSFWVDTFDASARWESFLRDEAPGAIAARVPSCATGPLALLGISMGGLGVLRLAFRSPDRYVAVAALEPGIDAARSWAEVDPDATGVRSLDLYERFHGSPVDGHHFDANHPPAMLEAGADAIAASGLQIYLECGDEDALGLYDAAELLHRQLWDRGIRHEYHLVRGADHIGRTLAPRFAEAIGFLGRALDPPGPDPVAEAFRAFVQGRDASPRLDGLDERSGPAR